MARMTCLTLALLIVAATPVATDADLLFQSDELLEITLTGPFGEIMETRSTEDELAGQLDYVDDAGETVTLDVKLRARGNFRRNPSICEFSPLRLNFAKQAVKDTLFDKQDKLKLVTHCKAKERRYEQSVIREYLAYRVLNAITDQSFQVRLLRVTYVDPASKRKPKIEYGIFIEHKDRLAKRLDVETADGIGRIKTSQLDMQHTALGSLFQFLIGNTDFSPISSREETECCHNYTLFHSTGDTFLSIPYDFDISGFVYAEYAKPNSRFNLRSVKQRLYRGRCEHTEQMDAALSRYRQQRDAIIGLIENQPELNKSSRRELIYYVGQFYDTIDDPKTLERRIMSRCL